MAIVDEIRLGPLRLQLQETTDAPGGHLVSVSTATSGDDPHEGGAGTTLEEWHKVKRFVGLEGALDEHLRPEDGGCECHCGEQK